MNISIYVEKNYKGRRHTFDKFFFMLIFFSLSLHTYNVSIIIIKSPLSCEIENFSYTFHILLSNFVVFHKILSELWNFFSPFLSYVILLLCVALWYADTLSLICFLKIHRNHFYSLVFWNPCKWNFVNLLFILRKLLTVYKKQEHLTLNSITDTMLKLWKWL